MDKSKSRSFPFGAQTFASCARLSYARLEPDLLPCWEESSAFNLLFFPCTDSFSTLKVLNTAVTAENNTWLSKIASNPCVVTFSASSTVVATSDLAFSQSGCVYWRVGTLSADWSLKSYRCYICSTCPPTFSSQPIETLSENRQTASSSWARAASAPLRASDIFVNQDLPSLAGTFPNLPIILNQSASSFWSQIELGGALQRTPAAAL